MSTSQLMSTPDGNNAEGKGGRFRGFWHKALLGLKTFLALYMTTNLTALGGASGAQGINKHS